MHGGNDGPNAALTQARSRQAHVSYSILSTSRLPSTRAALSSVRNPWVNTIQCKADSQAVEPMNSNNAHDPIVKFSNVALGYNDFTVLQDINLEVYKGQVVASGGT